MGSLRSSRVAVAALLVASLVGLLIVGFRQDDRSPRPVATATTAPSVVPPPTLAPTTSTTAMPPEAPTTVAPAALPPPAPGTDARAVVTPSGVVAPVVAKVGSGYRITTPCGRTADVPSATPVPPALVVLDAGHGGVEPGAVGPGGVSERELNLAVTKHAEAALRAAGLGVVLTRTAEYRITLGARAAIVKAVRPRAFVSIHHNAEPDEERPTPGAETYYQIADLESKRLAGLVYEEVVRALSQYQGVSWAADRDAGAKYRTSSRGEDYYGILRLTKGVPSVLAELGFVSNPQEEELYRRDDVRRVEGAAVARGIIRFLTTKDPGSGFTEPYPRESPAGGGGSASSCVDPPLT